MENKIIKEVNRVNKLMGNKNILSESPIPGIAKYLRKIFNSFGDDVAEKIVKTVKSGDDDLLRKLRSGEKLSADVVEAVIKALPSDLIAKIVVDDILAPAFNKNIDKVINAIKKDRSRYDELIGKMDEAIEEIGSNNEFNIDLINSIKENVTKRIDDAIGDMSSYNAIPRVLGKGARFAIKNSVKLHHLKIVRLYRDFFKSNDTLKNEIVSLVKGYQEGGSQYSQAYAVKIGEKLNVLESKMDRLGSDIWDQIKVDVPRDLKSKLDNIEVTKRWKELRETIQTDETIGKTVLDGWDKFKETLPFYFKKSAIPIRFKPVPLENLTKLVNFILTGQMQTTRELYERLVKAGAIKGSSLTYLRAVSPTLLIPTVIALGKTVLGPTGKGIENSINSIGGFFDKDWDVNVTDWEPEVQEGKVNVSNTIKQNFKSLVGDESSFFQYQGSDFIPGVNSYIDDLVDWYFTIGYKDSSTPPQPKTTISDVENNVKLKAAKLSAPKEIREFIWSDTGAIKLAGPNNVDYPITFEGGFYMVELPVDGSGTEKIKLKDY
tara:strand:- start:82 stop:1722 length:1641 start_codon:yes stop_codon:yes gene_type:complete